MKLGLGLRARASRLSQRARRYAGALARPRLLLKGDREDLSVLFSEPHDMSVGDRVVLYGLIRGLQPRNYLEIGVRWGGSARIVCTAMEANGQGAAVGLDPETGVFTPTERQLAGRYTLCRGFSPEDTPKAAGLLPGAVDFAFIDAVHTYDAVKVDVSGVLPYLSENAHILFHDAYHQGINQAVDEFLGDNPDFVDFGFVSKNPKVGTPVSYMGLRLIRRGATSFEEHLTEAHSRAGMPAPEFDPGLWNHDAFAKRIGNPLGRKS